MKKFVVSDIRWASEDDLKLPFWQDWNKKNRLPGWFWQRIWEYPYHNSKIPSSGKALDVGGTYPFILFKNWPNTLSVDCRDLNEIEHPLHTGLWPKGKLIVADAAKVPTPDNSYDYTFSVSAIEEMPHTVEVLKEMVRIAKHRVCITMDISEHLGVPRQQLRDLEEYLGVQIPTIPANPLTSCSRIIKKFGQKINPSLKSIRVLAFTLDSIDDPKTVAVLIPHWESYQFLKPCIESIKEHQNPSIKEKVYILDDASQDGSYEKLLKEYKDDSTVEVLRVSRANKKEVADVGLLLDLGLKEVTEQYVAMFDADAYPISSDWLAFPIWLIEKYGCSSAGMDTGLATGYLKKADSRVWWQPEEGYIPTGGLYDNDWYSNTNNLYRVMPTATAKVVSENIGFSRAQPRNYNSTVPKLAREIEFHLNKSRFGQSLYRGLRLNRLFNRRWPYLPGGCDNGVAANHFLDLNRMGPKFNIPLTSYIGLTPKDGAFAQNISGLVFHFALSTRALSQERREVEDAGNAFNSWVDRINKDGFNGKLLNEMIEASQKFQPGGYDGSIPASWYEVEYAYMQKLLKEYKNENIAHG